MNAMPWQTIYSQCYYNAMDSGALDHMPATLHLDDPHSCIDDPVCSTGKFFDVFSTFGDIPCVGDSSDGGGASRVWNATVAELIAGNDGPFGLAMTPDELDKKCSRSCLSREYCRNPIDKCHPWCEDFSTGYTDFFPLCLHDKNMDKHSFVDFCAKDESHREVLVATGLSHEEAEEEASSVCLSTYNDDIGTFEKFSEKSNVQLQNLLITVEMFLAALVHRKVFSYRDFRSGAKKSMAAGLRDMLPTEVLRDVQNLTETQAKKRAKELERVHEQAMGAVDDLLASPRA